MDLRTNEIRKEDNMMLNHDYLDKLDHLLDEVDRVLLSMDLDKETKRRLANYTYRLYAETEDAVMGYEY